MCSTIDWVVVAITSCPPATVATLPALDVPYLMPAMSAGIVIGIAWRLLRLIRG